MSSCSVSFKSSLLEILFGQKICMVFEDKMFETFAASSDHEQSFSSIPIHRVVPRLHRLGTTPPASHHYHLERHMLRVIIIGWRIALDYSHFHLSVKGFHSRSNFSAPILRMRSTPCQCRLLFRPENRIVSPAEDHLRISKTKT